MGFDIGDVVALTWVALRDDVVAQGQGDGVDEGVANGLEPGFADAELVAGLGLGDRGGLKAGGPAEVEELADQGGVFAGLLDFFADLCMKKTS